MKKLVFLLSLCIGIAHDLRAQEYMLVNGRSIPLSEIKSITMTRREHPLSLSVLLAKDERISLFVEALEATGMMDSLKVYRDINYSVGPDSTGWDNDALVIHTAVEYDNVAYPEKRFYKHSVFAPTDDVLKSYGVDDLDELKELAAQIYDAAYPEDADVGDVRNRRNSLNRFVSYHILPFQANYYQLTCVDGAESSLAKAFTRKTADISDWYETMMPHSLMKFSFPQGSEEGLYINRRGVESRPDARGVQVRGAKVEYADVEDERQHGVNGLFYCIDDILAYGLIPASSPFPTNANVNVPEVLFKGERMRFDCTTLSPDFLTSGARGHRTRSSIQNGKYGRGGQGARAATNVNTCLGFKSGSAANWYYSNSTHVHVRNRVLHFWSYQGDEVTVKGRFDVSVKLPPVPAGTYEVRLGTCTGFSSRGIVNCLIDGEIIGCFDLRPGGDDSKVGWKSDSSIGDAQSVREFDVQFHRKGWMKGMDSYGSISEDGTGSVGTTFRNQDNTLRKVLGRFTTDGKSDHYLRLCQMMASSNNEFSFDFIEVVPVEVSDNETYLEDML
ncbi:MAG: hypothetical protein IIT55_08365 [Bacteroidaceae bacterium]|nr:hypothetical protein [Bacteroidaceae bacterium]